MPSMFEHYVVHKHTVSRYD